MTDEKDKTESFFDMLDAGADKLVNALSQVHVPGKEYDDVPEVPRKLQLLFGPIRYAGQQPIFHLYHHTHGPSLCGRRELPDVWYRPNLSARESIVMCYGCLSAVVQGIASGTQSSESERRMLKP